MMLDAILYSDDKNTLFTLEQYLRETGMVQVQDTFSSGDVLLRSVREQKPDVVFLDMDTAGGKSLPVAAELEKQSPATDRVFVAAGKEYAMDAFDLNAVDYLLKPIQTERLMQSVEKLFEKHRRQAGDAVNPEQKRFVLHCLGEFAISNEAGEVLHWPSKKAQELVAFLWCQRKRSVSTAVLVETLWPYLDNIRARNNLYTAIYNAKKVLKRFLGQAVQVEKCSGGYQLVTTIESDVEQLEVLLDQCGEGEFEEKLRLYKQIMALYTGNLFQSEGFGWAEDLSAHLLETVQKYGLRLSNRLLEKDRWREAQEILQYLLLRDPCCEGAHILLIRMHARAEDIIGTRQSYMQYCKIVREKFSIEPRELDEILNARNAPPTDVTPK